MFSKKSLEGELIIDHRSAGAGITPEQAAQHGQDAIPVSAGGLMETSTITCSHCQAIVVKNPYRIRARNYCPKCDRYICDICESNRIRSGECKPFEQYADLYLEAITKGNNPIPLEKYLERNSLNG